MLAVIEASVNLEATLRPSFTLALFERVGPSEWRKVAGAHRGCVLGQRGSQVYSDAGEEPLAHWSGAWFSPEREFEVVGGGLSPRERSIVGALLSAHAGLSLSVSPHDMELMLIPVALSRRTDYERNVLRWCRAMWCRASTLSEVLRLDFRLVGTSYQLEQLKATLQDFTAKVAPRLPDLKDPWELRMALMECRYVGPKVADAYILFTKVDVSAAPVDVHMVRMALRLGLADFDALPSKALCSRFACYECPASDGCLRAALSRKYGGLAGWLQTALYVHDKLYCQARRCSSCPLRSYCSAAGSLGH